MNPRLSDAFRIWRMFSREQRRSARVMLFLMVVGVVLETAGIGLVRSEERRVGKECA